ncbi:hypothetical protein [Lacrimispora sp.]|uniref:hypothetical protein n=1 Tax=Lacrimispora sp. TaxID=2719234 RepID=UPI002FDB8291
MNTLFAYAYLWAFNFISKKKYNAHLDALFLEESNDEILLELEECSSDLNTSFIKLKRYFENEVSSFESNIFGKVLF